MSRRWISWLHKHAGDVPQFHSETERWEFVNHKLEESNLWLQHADLVARFGVRVTIGLLIVEILIVTAAVGVAVYHNKVNAVQRESEATVVAMNADDRALVLRLPNSKEDWFYCKPDVYKEMYVGKVVHVTFVGGQYGAVIDIKTIQWTRDKNS